MFCRFYAIQKPSDSSPESRKPCASSVSGVDGLEAVHARPAQLYAREVDQTRIHGDIKFLVDLQRVFPALQKLVGRRLILLSTFWSTGSKVLTILDSGLGDKFITLQVHSLPRVRLMGM